MTIARATALTRSDLVTRVRKEVRDRATQPSGTTIPEAARRFTDEDVQEALELALMDMANERLNVNAEEMWGVTSDLTPGSDGEVQLPSEFASAAGIVKVEELVGTKYHLIHRADPYEIDRFQGIGNYEAFIGGRRWCIVSDDSDFTTSGAKLRIFPTSSSAQVRVWYLKSAVLPGADTDSVWASTRWLELLTLEASAKLLRGDDELSSQQAADLVRLREQFITDLERNRAPRGIRSTRRRYHL